MSARFWSFVTVTGPDDCWLWTGPVSHGYGQHREGGRGSKNQRAHRIALASVQDVPEHAHVLHSCDQPLCVNPSHLRTGTHAENMRDMAERSRSRTTKLDAVDVLDIRVMASEGRRHADIAAEYGISKSNVQAIASRKTWRHVA